MIREIEPGEILVISDEGITSVRDHCGTKPSALCIFEYIYTARPDSSICDFSVHDARKRAGALLAKAHPVEADVVVGVPDSGLDAALGYAEASGIPYGIGLIKNKYIGRTFIAPGQDVREDKVKIKLNPVASTVRGKRVVLVDDSIVRGTTCGRIVRLLRNAGATEVHLRSSAPAFLNPCYYGTDIDSKDALIANNPEYWIYCDLVNASKRAVADASPLNALVDTIEAGLVCNAEPEGEPDMAHYDSLSAIKLGHLFAEELALFLE
jgi:amidophosphoribosyltransferase